MKDGCTTWSEFNENLDIEKEINEVQLTKREDYKHIPRKYVDAVNTIFNSRKYVQMSTFKVDGVTYYCVLVMRGIYLEPHFGVFLEGKFEELQEAVVKGDKVKIQELIKSDDFIQKDGYTNSNSNLVKVLSYIFSILDEYLTKREIGFVKVMGNPRKFTIYKKMVEVNLKEIPYKIIKEIDDEYTDKEGNVLRAKAIILKYNFA